MASGYQPHVLGRRRAIQLIGGAVLVSCVPTENVASTSPSPSGLAGTIGVPEKRRLVVGLRLPALNSQAPVLIAKDRGYFEEAGFQEIQIVVSQEQSAGITGGSIDLGVLPPIDIATAVKQGIPQRLIAAFRNYTNTTIAVRPEIGSVRDLDGRDILLGGVPGTRDFDRRAKLLKDAGWDIATVKPNAVTVAGGSDAWVRLFLEKKLWMVPIFQRHRRSVAEAGGKIVADKNVFGTDNWTATTSWLDRNPNTAAQFLTGYIRGLKTWRDLSNKEYVLQLGERNGFRVTSDVRDAYESDVLVYDGPSGPYDGGFSLDEMREYLSDFDMRLELKDFIVAGPLNRAQRALGLPPRPVL